MQRFRLRLADYVIMGCLIAAGLAGLWYNMQHGFAAGQKYVSISVNNRKVAELSLGENDHYSFPFAFGDDDEHRAVIEVEGGRVRMLPLGGALCPRGICSHTGWISHSYESIVCIPNRIMVVFTGVSPDHENIDGITY